MKLVLALITMICLSACVAENVPEGEMERMRASMPKDQPPPVSYNRSGIGTP